jgi:flagellar biosynthesis protein FlhB
MTEGFFKWLARNTKETLRDFLREVRFDRETRGVTEFIAGCAGCVLSILVPYTVSLLTPNIVAPFLVWAFVFALCVLVVLHGVYLWSMGES